VGVGGARDLHQVREPELGPHDLGAELARHLVHAPARAHRHGETRGGIGLGDETREDEERVSVGQDPPGVIDERQLLAVRPDDRAEVGARERTRPASRSA